MYQKLLLAIILTFLYTNFLCGQTDSLYNAYQLFDSNQENLKKLLYKNIAENPSDLRSYVILGSLYEEQLKYDSAQVVYQKTLKLDSTCSQCYQKLAGVMVANGMVKNAIENYEKALDIDSTNRNARIQLARLLKRENMFKKSIEHWRYLLLNDSANYYIFEQIGDCASRMNEMGWAWNAYHSSFYLNPNNMPVAAKIGQIGIQQNVPYLFFESTIDTALSIDSTYIPLLRVKGTMQFNMKEYEKSLSIYENAFQLGDSSRITLKHMGISCFNIGKFLKSSTYLEFAYNYDSTDVSLNYYWACSLINIGERVKAIDLLNSTEAIMIPDPKEMSLLYETRADAYQKGGEHKMALEQRLKALEFDPKNKDIVYNIAFHFDLTEKDAEKAIDYYEKYLELSNEKSDKYRFFAAKDAIKRLREGLFFEDRFVKLKAKKTQSE